MKKEILINQEEWQEILKGYYIIGCAVRNANIIYLTAKQSISQKDASLMFDSDITARFIMIDREPNEDEENSAHIEFTGFNHPKTGVSRTPIEQGLIVSRNNKGSVYAMGSGEEGIEHILPEGGNPAPHRIVCIDSYAYAVCDERNIYKRIAIGKWEKFNDKGIPPFPDYKSVSEMQQISLGMGFNDMDGPNENNLYAVGGHGDVWHYDGKQWKWCDFPTNEQLATVTVAPDGTVYISSEGGTLWAGREHSWQELHKGNSSILFNDSVWFNDQLWLCSDYQLRVWDGKTLRNPTFPDGSPVAYSGHMDAYDGLLVVASLFQVHAFDGKEWQCLVAPYEKV